jgi:hypothetical protein
MTIAGAWLPGAPAFSQVPQTPPVPALVPAPGQPATQAQAAPPTRVFASDAGLVLNFIKPDKTAQFEGLIAKLKEALGKSDKPERQQQAKSWKVFKSADPAAAGSALYVFFSDPAVKSADYTVTTILAEAFPPDEARTMLRQYAECFAAGQNWVNLALITELGK